LAKKIKYNIEDEENIVIANMNVDGMPWYKKEDRQTVSEQPEQREVLGKKETFYVIMGSLKAALIIALIMSAGIILFVLFCTQVWFR